MAARSASGMPLWVKIFIGIGLVAVIAFGVLAANGHGPWQHAGMAGMHQ